MYERRLHTDFCHMCNGKYTHTYACIYVHVYYVRNVGSCPLTSRPHAQRKPNLFSLTVYRVPLELAQGCCNGFRNSYHTRIVWNKPSSHLPRAFPRVFRLKFGSICRRTWTGGRERHRDSAELRRRREGQAVYHWQLTQRRIPAESSWKQWVKYVVWGMSRRPT